MAYTGIRWIYTNSETVEEKLWDEGTNFQNKHLII